MMAEVAINAMHSNVQGALLGLLCGAVVNTLLYSVAIFGLAKLRSRLRSQA